MSFMDGQNYYTPQELNAMRANNERALLNAQNLNTGLSIAQNLGANGSLGFLLGTIGGSSLSNYLKNRDMDRIAKVRETWANNQFNPRQIQNPAPTFNANGLTPEQPQSFVQPTYTYSGRNYNGLTNGARYSPQELFSANSPLNGYGGKEIVVW